MITHIFTTTCLLKSLVLITAFSLSCEMLKPGEPIAFTTVEDYSALPYFSKANIVFQDNVTLRDFWIKHAYDTLFMRLPKVDFSASTLICVFMGICPSTGYSTTVEEVRDFGDEIVVAIVEQPCRGVGCAILTYPQHLVTIPKTTLPIEFKYCEKVTSKSNGNLDQ